MIFFVFKIVHNKFPLDTKSSFPDFHFLIYIFIWKACFIPWGLSMILVVLHNEVKTWKDQRTSFLCINQRTSLRISKFWIWRYIELHWRYVQWKPSTPVANIQQTLWSKHIEKTSQSMKHFHNFITIDRMRLKLIIIDTFDFGGQILHLEFKTWLIPFQQGDIPIKSWEFVFRTWE